MSRVIAVLLLVGSVLTYSFARRTISGATMEVAEATVDYNSSRLSTLIPVPFILVVTATLGMCLILTYLIKQRRSQ